MRSSQQDFIKDAIDYLGLTKTALAIKLNTSVSMVNAWLSQSERIGYQPLPDFIQEKIHKLVQDKRAAHRFPVLAGTASPTQSGQYCEKYDFHFPTLYRATRRQQDQTQADSIDYTLSDQSESGDLNEQFEALPHLDPQRDSVWVFINEHSSMNAVLGYWRAISHSNPDSVSERFKLYLFEDHLFSIYHIQKPEDAMVNNIVYYQIEDNEFQIAMPSLRRKLIEDWSLILDGHGKVREKSEIWRK